ESVARRAICRLAASPCQSVPFLSKRLKPADSLSERQLRRLLADLDSNRFAVRQRATAELGRLGGFARSALCEVLKENPSLEVRRRVENLLERIDKAKRPPEQLVEVRCIEVLEYAGTSEAREVLKRLTGGDPRALLTREAKASLRRLATR